MNGMTTRARTDRTVARPRRDGSSHGAYVDGANALQIGHPDPAEVQAAPAAEPRRRRTRPGITLATEPTASSASLPLAPPLPVALPRAPFLVMVVSLVVVGVLGVLMLNTKINENSFRLNDLRKQQAALDLQEQQLARELAELESPGNLDAASKRLGLVPAGTPAFISLPDGRVVGIPQPAHVGR